MSKVKIEGNPSGTGTLTIAAPNTNTDRTLTLPDEGGEVLLNGTSSNVGIGTTTINDRLVVASNSAAEGITLRGDGYDAFKINMVNPSVDNNVNLNVAISNALLFSTNNTERMRIDSSGRVGINRTNPSAVLHVVGNANPTSYFQVSGNGNQAIIFHNASAATAGYITVNTSSVSYNTSSDYRLKTDVQPMTGATDRLKALKPVNFEWISSGERVDGFLAHEAQEVVPESVTGTKDAMRTEEYEVTPAVLDDDGNVVTEAVMGEREVPDYQGIDQSKLTPLLTAALQEAIAKIEDLESRLAALETV